ncbi:Hydroxyacylglutathione hydrolase [Shewanella baltica OS625]|uniref:Hydroxyacylglutathione hydrolase n=1 Tax=Shewanella baltica (strain OS195) TaxID=399599 RepID=GLO2_SHEB9|nr:hydroxyacylglutathione hydrolase [Shewanella baltica]A9L0E9.1 RecName: Full=Hydroxyacylglutathione hydrolase; AltName: Full=Glyoxalase II; Short=Glx II [Shewanella baltica OS195]ABX49229.1 hydroxyacylglutathione hydrolase [Shewanella baltica OS195]ADT94220.1 hydroxyacylglutathione hydrolase [Shewanella baltica OS678]EHC04236.1 Hydroxyacylglutathione hydrolase [Shewanella baltica OS625]
MLTITAIKAFNDNYIWVLQQQPHTQVYVVDPGDASVVIDYLEANQLTLVGILLTHHHNDHTGGVAELQAYSQDRLTVYGPDNEKIEGITHPLHATAQPRFTLDYISGELQVLDVPGHTAGHIAYVIADALFCGDTLFSGGCGRLFEGTPAQMLNSLQQLAQLPAYTRVYCAHEYTLSNLKFALAVNPNNCALQDYNERAIALRRQDKATIPSTIALERAINPFLRASDTEIVGSIKQHFSDLSHANLDELGGFTLLRQWKDNF